MGLNTIIILMDNHHRPLHHGKTHWLATWGHKQIWDIDTVDNRLTLGLHNMYKIGATQSTQRTHQIQRQTILDTSGDRFKSQCGRPTYH